MTVDYGTDLHCTDDLDPMFPEVTGRTVLIEAIYRRLITPRGALLDAPDYGLDLRSYLSFGLTPRDITDLQTDLARECLKDERVASCDALVSLNFATRAMTVVLSIVDGTGPFKLVLAADSVTVAILRAQ